MIRPIAVAAALVAAGAALGAPSKPKAPQPAKPSAKDQAEFSKACFDAYTRGRAEAPLEVGKRVCDCAGPEAKSQGASAAALKRETEALRRNAKHEFEDTHVLDAIKHCTIAAFQFLDR